MSQNPAAHHDGVSAGAVLAGAREQLNLTVPEVARHLKLSPAQVEALEAGAYDRLPGRVFVRGFLRNYAKLLGVDPQPLLRSIDYEIPRPEVVEEMRLPDEPVIPREERSRWPLYTALAAVIIVGGLAVYEFGFNEAGRNTATRPVGPAPSTQAETQTQTAAAVPPQQAAANVPAQPEKPADAAPSTSGASLPVLARAVAPTESASAEIRPATASAAPAGAKQLRFVFNEDSWIEIRDGTNKVIFSKLNRAGSEERVTGTPPFKLVVGNARGVLLRYDDKPIDLAPHTGVTVARLTLE
jgi:cytoskeleton protein RodZ